MASLEQVTTKKIDSTLRSFKLAYLSYLRTAKPVGHTQFAANLRLYCDLFNAYKNDSYNSDEMLRQAKIECREQIDAEHQQQSFDLG